MFFICFILGTSVHSFLTGIYTFILFEAIHMSLIYVMFKAYVK